MKTDMKIRRVIFVPMIVLTIVCCTTVLMSSIVLFDGELTNAMHDKVNVATDVVESEIKILSTKAQIAAFGMATNPDLIEALVNNDRDGIIRMANSLQAMAQIDFCNIIDTEGNVITRTHAPDILAIIYQTNLMCVKQWTDIASHSLHKVRSFFSVFTPVRPYMTAK